MAQQWTPAPTAAPQQTWTNPPHHPQRSGLFKAGEIMLLIGAILHTVGAGMLLVGGAILLLVGRALRDSAFPTAVVGTVYLVAGVLLAIGSFFAWSAWKRAKAGDAHTAWVRGLVASLLPPLQVVSLVAAILCKVSPEGEAQARAKAP